jgi:nickel/cobalt transporter (NicO) family protein
MSVPFSTVATGVIGVSLLHSLVPHHWLPFVAVGRKHKWTTGKTLSLLSLGASVHIFSTIMVGLLVGYLGHQIDQRYEALHGIVPGLILILFGGGFILFNSSHFHEELSEKMAASTLIVMLGVSPCVIVAPLFLILGPMGLKAIIEVCLAMALLSVAGMTFFGWLAIKGLNAMKLDWLEKYESRVIGGVLILLGVSFIIF